MNRNEAIEKAAQAVVDEAFYLRHDTHLVHELVDALELSENIDEAISEYEREMCPWDDVEYLHKCADQYANVKEPSHLHCLVVVLSRKLKALQGGDA